MRKEVIPTSLLSQAEINEARDKAFELLSEKERQLILDAAQKMQINVRKLGPVGAFEALAATAEYVANHED